MSALYGLSARQSAFTRVVTDRLRLSCVRPAQLQGANASTLPPTPLPILLRCAAIAITVQTLDKKKTTKIVVFFVFFVFLWFLYFCGLYLIRHKPLSLLFVVASSCKCRSFSSYNADF